LGLASQPRKMHRQVMELPKNVVPTLQIGPKGGGVRTAMSNPFDWFCQPICEPFQDCPGGQAPRPRPGLGERPPREPAFTVSPWNVPGHPRPESDAQSAKPDDFKTPPPSGTVEQDAGQQVQPSSPNLEAHRPDKLHPTQPSSTPTPPPAQRAKPPSLWDEHERKLLERISAGVGADESPTPLPWEQDSTASRWAAI
jgi:hypothetical protein